ncbi:cytochrome P450 4c3 isoform X3 [Manduca sexta]|uniref:cytochrome P450 4c3 isoform X3 n=1 Tax=Manduca sexta TaxID=7130 RepID=UPI001182D3E9|nr:cytochrome P450 4c3 isoform X3 [Manduca sexta]
MALWLLFLIGLLWPLVFRYRRRHMYKLASVIPAPSTDNPVLGIAHELAGNTEAAILWLLVYRFRRRNMYRLGALVPGCSSEIPLLGITHTLVGNTEDIMTTLQKYSYEAMEHNGIIKGWLGHILYFVLLNPVDLELVLKTCMEKDDLHRFLRKIIGNGGIFAPGKGTFSIWPYLTAYTLDSVCETAMGVKINAQENPDSTFLKNLNRLLNLICERIFHLWLQPEWMFKLFPQYKEHERCMKQLHDFTDDVIRKKRIELEVEQKNKTEVDYEYDLGLYKRKTFLDLLITLSGGSDGYTNEELREEVLTLTIAGTDTSAVALGFTLKLLGKYPEIQEKVYQELRDVFGDTDRPLVKEDLTKMKYLERVVKESLRLFPPVPFIIRKVLEDIKLPSGHVLPGGSGIVISIWGIHRDPKYWGPDAEHFDPDRFLPERFNLAHGCSYMPFSSGPRNCLGYQYALMSVKAALSGILRNYKVVGKVEDGPVPKIRVKLDIMMKAVDGYQLELEKRATKAA